eukprot:a180727_49.p1 GENE.a180727_49~~a180727_49.p1  ORF type:complete len:135 (-),score=13.96 a180727_49:76-453(-)
MAAIAKTPQEELEFAVGSRRIEDVRRLLASGSVDVNKPTSRVQPGSSLLHVAVHEHAVYVTLVELLLEHGARPEAQGWWSFGGAEQWGTAAEFCAASIEVSRGANNSTIYLEQISRLLESACAPP